MALQLKAKVGQTLHPPQAYKSVPVLVPDYKKEPIDPIFASNPEIQLQHS